MSVSSDGKKISGPIFWGDPYTVLRVSPSTSAGYDAGTIICHENINKWSKHKPIRYDQFEPLTELQFAGTINDRVDGIFYGLKLANVGGRIETMHEATFEYMRVRPGTDKVRKTDWDGYDHAAKPNPIGTLPEIIHVDVAPAHGVIEINYDTYNTTGVNIADVIASMSTSGADLKNFYPCVLVTVGNKKYCRALWNMAYDLLNLNNSDRKYLGYTTFYHNNTWARQWALITQGLPGAVDGATLTATVFFQRSIGVGNGGVAGDPDFREWQAVDSLIVMNTGYACPEAVAKTIQLRNLITKGLNITGGSWGRSTTLNNIMVGLSSEWIQPAEGATYTLNGTLYDSSNEPIGSLNGSYAYHPDLMLLLSFDVKPSLLLIPETTVFTLRWTVTSSLRPASPCNSGTTTLAFRSSSIVS